MTLDTLKPGDICLARKILANGKLNQRLMDLGLYPGLEIKIVRNAPLQDPIEIKLGGYFLSIRHEEAAFVEVDQI